MSQLNRIWDNIKKDEIRLGYPMGSRRIRSRLFLISAFIEVDVYFSRFVRKAALGLGAFYFLCVAGFLQRREVDAFFISSRCMAFFSLLGPFWYKDTRRQEKRCTGKYGAHTASRSRWA